METSSVSCQAISKPSKGPKKMPILIALLYPVCIIIWYILIRGRTELCPNNILPEIADLVSNVIGTDIIKGEFSTVYILATEKETSTMTICFSYIRNKMHVVAFKQTLCLQTDACKNPTVKSKILRGHISSRHRY